MTASTATTNWNSADYWRLYSVSTAAAAVSSYTDSREIGRMTGAGSGMTAPVTKNRLVDLGSLSPETAGLPPREEPGYFRRFMNLLGL